MAEIVEIRSAVASDLDALNDLYNHYVRESHATFDIDPISMGSRQEWFRHYSTRGPYRLLVATDSDGLVGYATSSPLHERAAYRPSVQTSVYVAPGRGRRGIGSALYGGLLPLLADEDVHRAYAGIALPNPGSVALHERFGFRRVGHFTEQGRKFGRYWDVAWFERPVP